MAIARVTVLDFADEESKKRNLQLYEQRWKQVFPNMHMNMIISTGPPSFLSISVYDFELSVFPVRHKLDSIFVLRVHLHLETHF